MSYYALIKDGIVENTICADSEFIKLLPNATDYVEYESAGIGWTYDGVNFIPPKCHEEAILNATKIEWECVNVGHNPIS